MREHSVFKRISNAVNTSLCSLYKIFFAIWVITFSYLICRIFSKRDAFCKKNKKNCIQFSAKQRKPNGNRGKSEKIKNPALNFRAGAFNLIFLFLLSSFFSFFSFFSLLLSPFSFSLFFLFSFFLLSFFLIAPPISSYDALHQDTSRKYVSSSQYSSLPGQTLSCLLFLFYSILQPSSCHQLHKDFLTPPRK